MALLAALLVTSFDVTAAPGVAAVTAIGVANNAMTAGTNYFLSGTWNGSTFTVTNDGVGADTMIVQGYAGAGVDIDTNNDVILVGCNSATLTAANLV